MNKLIDFLNKYSVEDCIKLVEEQNIDKRSFVLKLNQVTSAFNIKVHKLVTKLSEVTFDFDVDSVITAKADCFNLFKKDQEVIVTSVEGNVVTLDGLISLQKEIVYINFTPK